jgi:hypothetical protein
MSDYFRAVAVDYDGTLTEEAAPDDAVLAALARTRSSGQRVLLVTGRRLEELVQVFPAALQTFDAIVAENGGVVWNPALGTRTVAHPVPAELDPALALRGVPFERGRVLVATDASWDQTVFQEIARLGLEVQLVRNRGALMLLPPGISKGTGLLEALSELGISPHSTLAVGDADPSKSSHSLAAMTYAPASGTTKSGACASGSASPPHNRVSTPIAYRMAAARSSGVTTLTAQWRSRVSSAFGVVITIWRQSRKAGRPHFRIPH